MPPRPRARQSSLLSSGSITKPRRPACRRCNKDQTRCEDVQDGSLSSACKRCARYGHTCLPGQQPPRRPASAAQTAPRLLTAGDQVVPMTPASSVTQENPYLTVPSVPNGYSSRGRPLVVDSGTPLQGSIPPHSSDYTPHPARHIESLISLQPVRDLEDPGARRPRNQLAAVARNGLARMGDLCATKEVLHFYKDQIVARAEKWLGDNTHLPQLRTIIEDALGDLRQQFDTEYENVIGLLDNENEGENVGNVKAEYLNSLNLIADIWVSANGSKLCRRTPDPYQRVRELRRQHDRKRRQSKKHDISIASHMICSGLSLQLEPGQASKTHVEDLKDAADAVSDVLHGLGLTSRSEMNLRLDDQTARDHKIHPSACNLAAMRAPCFVKQLSASLPTIFFMGISPYHLIHYLHWSDDFDFLLGLREAVIFWNEHDALGLTPLLITACKDDVERFRKLCKNKNGINFEAADCMGRNALHLAALNGAIKVLRYILFSMDPSIRSQLLTQDALLPAIMAGQPEAAQTLLDFYKRENSYWIAMPIANEARQQAVARGYNGIVTALDGLQQPHLPDNSNALEDLSDSDLFNVSSKPVDVWPNMPASVHGFMPGTGFEPVMDHATTTDIGNGYSVMTNVLDGDIQNSEPHPWYGFDNDLNTNSTMLEQGLPTLGSFNDAMLNDDEDPYQSMFQSHSQTQ